MVFKHGVEYHVNFDASRFEDGAPIWALYQRWFPSGTVVIASMKEVDPRLLESPYYLERKAEWFMGHCGKKEILSGEILSGGLGIELTSREMEYLRFILKEFGGAVTGHGWYDIARFT